MAAEADSITDALPSTSGEQQTNGPSPSTSPVPTKLGLIYSDLCKLDIINIDLAPEKKGLFLKYNEYQITSQRLNSKVLRRYNDFFAFHELLLCRFPYRLIPKLPPKKIVGATDSQFIEERRKSLKRWLILVVRHPIVGLDPLTNFFLTFAGPEFQQRIKDMFRGIPDEFTTSNLASQAKDLVQAITATELANSREHICSIMRGMSRLKQIAELLVDRSQRYAEGMADLGCQLSNLAADPSGASDWGSGGNTAWSNMKRGFQHIAKEFAQLSSKALQQSIREEDEVCERLNLLLDVLGAHRQLCERHEKGVAQDHQKALDKMLTLKKKQIQGSIRGTDGESVEQLEIKMIKQESIIANVELRSAFSLHCMHLETQLVHAYLELVSDIICSLVSVEMLGHQELADVWKQIQPKILQCLPETSDSSAKNSLSSFMGATS